MTSAQALEANANLHLHRNRGSHGNFVPPVGRSDYRRFSSLGIERGAGDSLSWKSISDMKTEAPSLYEAYESKLLTTLKVPVPSQPPYKQADVLPQDIPAKMKEYRAHLEATESSDSTPSGTGPSRATAQTEQPLCSPSKAHHGTPPTHSSASSHPQDALVGRAGPPEARIEDTSVHAADTVEHERTRGLDQDRRHKEESSRKMPDAPPLPQLTSLQQMSSLCHRNVNMSLDPMSQGPAHVHNEQHPLADDTTGSAIAQRPDKSKCSPFLCGI